MSATSVTPVPSTSFWTKLKSWLPAIEMAGNVALLASGVGAGFEPLVASLENAVKPLLQVATQPVPVTSTLLNVYATIIGVLTALKGVKNLPQATLDKINEYVGAAQDATSAYVTAEAGFDPANYLPVDPIK